MNGNLCALVLAAGRGERFRERAGPAQDKLLAQCIGLDGIRRPVLEHVLFNLRQWTGPRLLVTRRGKDAVAAIADRYGWPVLEIESDGLGDSLAAGVAAIPGVGGWQVFLGDMPFIQPETAAQVAEAVQPGTIAVPHGNQGAGHPVGFAAEWGCALRALQGDRGARHLLKPAVVVEVKVADEGIYRDIDTPEQLGSRP